MRLKYLLRLSLAIIWLGALPFSKNNFNPLCHSSMFMPLDPILVVQSAARVVRSNPESSQAHRELGAAYLSLFDGSEFAKQEFREAVRLDPSSSAGYTGLGWSELRINSPEMGISFTRRNSNIDVERYSDALSLFDQALALDPDNAGAHLGRAQACAFLGRSSDAQTSCRAAVGLCPNSGEAWDLLGDVCIELGRYDEAIDAYKTEIDISTTGGPLESLSPRNNRGRFDVALLYRIVGDTLFSLDRTREAIAQYEKALSNGEDTSAFHHRLTLAYYQIGEPEKYESHLESLRTGCSRSSTGDGDWCHFYEDVVERLSRYRANPEMSFYIWQRFPTAVE